MYKVVIVVLQDCDCSNTVYRKTHKIYTQPSIQGRLLANMVVGGRNEKYAVLTQKCGDDLCTIGGNTASVTANRILTISLKLKNRD